MGGFYSFPLVSFDFLWFWAGWILWFSFGFLCFTLVLFGRNKGKENPRKKHTNQGKFKEAISSHKLTECINHACYYPDRPIVWIKGFKPVVQTIVLNFFSMSTGLFFIKPVLFSFHPPSGLFLFCKIRFKDYICFKNIFWIFFDF